ncbi:MAG TPA: DUF2997 domain-containing protein [Desulfobacteraceae bacterium]|nr:DUF2997 domain-containing protein [Desulfobacteraceae bacterium]
MADTEIKVVVEKNGKVKLSLEGVTGTQCLPVTAFLEKELGEVCARQRTGDFYKSRQAVVRNRITISDTAA